MKKLISEVLSGQPSGRNEYVSMKISEVTFVAEQGFAMSKTEVESEMTINEYEDDYTSGEWF